jgi:hypothetical protein
VVFVSAALDLDEVIEVIGKFRARNPSLLSQSILSWNRVLKWLRLNEWRTSTTTAERFCGHRNENSLLQEKAIRDFASCREQHDQENLKCRDML